MHDGRSDRESCHAWRFEHRRARSPDWIRRTTRHRADHPSKITRRIPAQRVSLEARYAGRGCDALRNEELHRASAGFLCRSGPTRRGMTFADTVQFLLSLGHELKTTKWDLARIEALLRTLGDPHRRPRFIHVAGT